MDDHWPQSMVDCWPQSSAKQEHFCLCTQTLDTVQATESLYFPWKGLKQEESGMAHCQPLPLWTGCMPDAEGPPQLFWGIGALLAVDKDHPTCKQQYHPGCYFQTTRLWGGIESAFPPRKKVWTGGNTTANQIDIFVPLLDIVTGLSTKLNLIRRCVNG